MAFGKWSRPGGPSSPSRKLFSRLIILPRSGGDLVRLGIDQLTFGTEEVLDYQAITTIYSGERGKWKLSCEIFQKTYPIHKKRPKKCGKTFCWSGVHRGTPNHILGLAYAKACAGKGIALKPIQRQGAGYHSEEKRGGLCFCD